LLPAGRALSRAEIKTSRDWGLVLGHLETQAQGEARPGVRFSDIAIVGGGFAGALAALVLARDGWSVTVIDPHESFPPLFRADKIDANQLDLLGRLGLRDAFRTSCPAVGTGLSCIMVDLMRLREHIARWMTTPGMGAEKIAAFYADPAKTAFNARAHADAIERRRSATEASLRQRLKATSRFFARAVRSRALNVMGREPARLRKAN
jgi:hypothetical protein